MVSRQKPGKHVTFSAENLLEDMGGVLRGRGATSQQPQGAVACCSLFLSADVRSADDVIAFRRAAAIKGTFPEVSALQRVAS